MLSADPPLKKLNIRSLFLVWGPPHGSHRTELLGRQLGADVHHISFTARRGWLLAPLKYFVQTWMTLVFLFRTRYRLIFVQDPPIFAVLPVYLYSRLTGASFIIDSHTDALQAPFWAWTLPLHRFLERRAIVTLVTNDLLREKIAAWGNRSLTLEDPPIEIGDVEKVQLSGTFNVVVVSSAAYDEPIPEILRAARALPDIEFYITGNFARSPHHRGVAADAPANVHFTGYLPDAQYDGLLAAADAIMCLTTEDNTFLSGNNEALWWGKPLITSDWPILRRYFNRGSVHVDNSADQIRAGVLAVRAQREQYHAEMLALQEEQRRAWWARAEQLLALIQQSLRASARASASKGGKHVPQP